jgi:hypothetical protein
MHSMRPGCTAEVSQCADVGWAMMPADYTYPVESIAVEAVATEIRDWLSLRRYLIDIWRASYEEFRHEFVRDNRCREFPTVWL